MKQTSTFYHSLCSLLPGALLVLLPLLGWGRGPATSASQIHKTLSCASGSDAAKSCAVSHRSAPLKAAAPTAVVYTWSATGTSASWSAPGSWTPARTNPDVSDVLQFTSSSAAATVVVDFITSQTIAGLFISTSNAVTFSTDGTDGVASTSNTRTLNISNGNTGPDLTLAAGSTLTVYTTTTAATSSANTGLTMTLGSGATATIGGHLTFDSAVANTNMPNPTSQILQGSGNSVIEFMSGSVFTAGSNFKGYPFGNTAASANSVVFRNGSRYEYNGGSTPFGTSSSAVTSFEPASYFYYAPPSSATLASSGRTYGNLEYNLPATRIASSSGAGGVTIAGDLIITSGVANISVTGNVVLKGNVLMNGGTLNFVPGSATTVQFTGTTAQTIGGTAAASSSTFNANVTVQVNNAAGLTLGQPISIPGALQLTSGALTTSATNPLTLAAGATVSAGSATSFINGPLRLTIGAVSAATTYNFPIGKNGVYRPLALNITSQTGTTIYQAEQFEQDGVSGSGLVAPLQRVSRNRFFTITPYNTAGTTVTQPSGFNGTLTVSFGTSDRVTSPAAASFMVAKRADGSQPWATTGASTSNTSMGSVQGPLGTFYSGTLTSGSFSSFSDFVLASTEADPSVNPLPVQLTSFLAARSARGDVALTWATASELRSACFKVERSFDGRTFEKLATVAAAGTSAQARAYTARDADAPSTQLYYRLHLVDTDGTASYSLTISVAASTSELALAPNPAHDQLSLLTEAATAYTVRNPLGQSVLAGTTQAGAPTTLDVHGLTAGVYFFELHGGTGRVVRRFVKE